MVKTRTESDSLGPIEVPAQALWGAQTQRAVDNFPISGWTMPASFIQAVALIKLCAAEVNQELGLLDEAKGRAIVNAAKQVVDGAYADQFPVDEFQDRKSTRLNSSH